MTRFEISLVLALVFITLCAGAMAQSSTCTSTLMSLSSCINYVTGNVSTPSPTCCSSLDSVVKSQPQCLCPLINGSGSSLGIAVNQTLALALPNVCNVQTPPLSQCNAVANGPATAPASSPVGSPAPSAISTPSDAAAEPPKSSTPASIPSEPSGTGSKTVPKTTQGTSDATATKPLAQLVAFTLFIAALATSLKF